MFKQPLMEPLTYDTLTNWVTSNLGALSGSFNATNEAYKNYRDYWYRQDHGFDCCKSKTYTNNSPYIIGQEKLHYYRFTLSRNDTIEPDIL